MCVEGDEHMFRIAICDDERQFRKRIHDILIEYMNENDILYEIDEFESGKDFISLGSFCIFASLFGINASLIKTLLMLFIFFFSSFSCSPVIPNILQAAQALSIFLQLCNSLSKRS